MPETFTPWNAVNYLRTPEDAGLYLEACSLEDPGDGSLTSTALSDIARSGSASRIAQEMGMSREGLHKALSEKGDISFAAVMQIARALGMQVRITERTGT